MKQNSKGRLQDFFDVLTESEKEKFHKWVQLELEGKDQAMWAWFNTIRTDMNYEKAWNTLFPSKAFDQKCTARWNSRLLEFLELYVSIEEFKKDTSLQKLYLNRFSLRRSPEICYPQSIKKSRSQLAKDKCRDYTHFWIKNELDRLDLEYKFKFPHSPIRGIKLIPEEVNKNFKLYILLKQAEVILSRMNNEFRVDEEWISRVIADLQSTLQNLTFIDSPNVVQFYFQILSYYYSKEVLTESLTQALILLFQTCFKNLRSDAQYSSFLLVYNYLVISLNRSPKLREYLAEKLDELCSWFYSKKEMHISGTIYRNHIKRYIQLAQNTQNSAEETERYLSNAETFIESNKMYLLSPEREGVYLYCRALILFQRKAFEAILKIQAQIVKDVRLQASNIHQDISFTYLFLKSLYEEKQRLEDLASLLQNLDKKVSGTKKLNANHKATYRSNIKFFQKLLSVNSKSKIKKALLLLDEPNFAIDKVWLRRKLEEKLEPKL